MDPLSGTTQVSWYQKGKTKLDFIKARDSEWQWHQLGSMQVCTLLQTDNHASTPSLCFLQAGCPSCCPTNSVNVQGNNNVSWPAIVAMGKMQMCKSADVAVKISSELRLRLGPGLRLWCHICTSVFHPSRATILRWSVVYVLPNYAFLYMRNSNALITMTNIISRH